MWISLITLVWFHVGQTCISSNLYVCPVEDSDCGLRAVKLSKGVTLKVLVKSQLLVSKDANRVLRLASKMQWHLNASERLQCYDQSGFNLQTRPNVALCSWIYG